MKHANFSFQYKWQLFKADELLHNTEGCSLLLLAVFRMENFLEMSPIYPKVVGY